MTTDNFCFYLQNGLIETSQTGGQWYSDTSPSLLAYYEICQFPLNYESMMFYSIGPLDEKCVFLFSGALYSDLTILECAVPLFSPQI